MSAIPDGKGSLGFWGGGLSCDTCPGREGKRRGLWEEAKGSWWSSEPQKLPLLLWRTEESLACRTTKEQQYIDSNSEAVSVMAKAISSYWPLRWREQRHPISCLAMPAWRSPACKLWWSTKKRSNMAGGSSVNNLPGPLALPGRRCPSRKTMALSYSRTTCRGKQKLGWRGRRRTEERDLTGMGACLFWESPAMGAFQQVWASGITCHWVLLCLQRTWPRTAGQSCVWAALEQPCDSPRFGESSPC